MRAFPQALPLGFSEVPRNLPADPDHDFRGYYAMHDANFDVTALVNASGAVVERCRYTPYGRRTVLDADFSADADGKSDYDFHFGHQGLLHDQATGLIYNLSRMYHPQLGRFMQRDLLRYGDGMSVYLYLRANPLIYVDPYGLSCQTFSRSIPGMHQSISAVPVAPGVYVQGSVGWSLTGEAKKCDKCCPDGQEVEEVTLSIHGDLSATIKITGGVAGSLPLGPLEVDFWAGIQGTGSGTGSGSGSGSTDKCNGQNDISSFSVCGSATELAKIAGGGMATATIGWWFEWKVGVEVFGTASMTQHACIHYRNGQWSWERPKLGPIEWNAGITACFGSCYTLSLN